jgi:hypothetical protein
VKAALDLVVDLRTLHNAIVATRNRPYVIWRHRNALAFALFAPAVAGGPYAGGARVPHKHSRGLRYGARVVSTGERWVAETNHHEAKAKIADEWRPARRH